MIFPCIEEDVGSPPIICSTQYSGNLEREDVRNGTYEMTVKVNTHTSSFAHFIRETTGCLALEFSGFDTLALGFESFVFF